MARTHKRNASTVFNNYIMLPFQARVLSGNNDVALELARMGLPANFRTSHAQYFGLGVTANVLIDFRDITNTIGVHSAVVLNAAGAPVEVTTESMGSQNNQSRDMPKGAQIVMEVTNNGTGATIAGGVMGWLTGYFTEPISHQARHGESGQQASDRPSAGYYCIMPMRNVRANANQALRTECSMIAPWDCRVQAIQYNGLGITTTTGSITALVRNETQTTDIHTALDFDTNLNFCVDDNSTPAFASDAARDINRGDLLDFRLSTGIADSIPIGTASANLLVWVKGHANVDPTVPD